MKQTESALVEARDAALRGWPVIALPAARKVPFKGSHGVSDATTDLATIERWGIEHPDCNFAVAGGAAVVVVEVDPRRGGDATLNKLRVRYGDMPETARARSGGGGPHFYFHPGAMALKSRKDAWGAGIELKAAGTYALLPGSQNSAGKRYDWVRHPDDFPVATVPNWVAEIAAGGDGHIGDAMSECLRDVRSHLSDVSDLSETPSARDSSNLSDLSETSVDEIIRLTLPTRAGQRNDSVLNLARGLKFNLRMKSVAMSELRGIVRQWHEAALPIITSKSFDETWTDFIHAFPRAKYPLGMNLVDQAAGRVDPNELPAVAARYDSAPMKKLVALCDQLSRLNKGRFFLSSHDAGPRIGVDQRQAWRMLRALCSDGVLDLVDKGNARCASRYRWIGGANDQR